MLGRSSTVRQPISDMPLQLLRISGSPEPSSSSSTDPRPSRSAAPAQLIMLTLSRWSRQGQPAEESAPPENCLHMGSLCGADVNEARVEQQAE